MWSMLIKPIENHTGKNMGNQVALNQLSIPRIGKRGWLILKVLFYF